MAAGRWFRLCCAQGSSTSLNCHSERSEESLPAAVVFGVGMLRLRRSFASLHSGSAQHDSALNVTGDDVGEDVSCSCVEFYEG